MKNRIALGLLLAAAGVALAAMHRGAGGFHLNGFYPWVLGPYLILGLIVCAPRNGSADRLLAGRLSAGLVLLLSGWMYIDAMWFSRSSTSALIFIFAPLYLLVAGLLSWSISVAFLAWKARRRRA